MPDDTPITRPQADHLLEYSGKVLAEIEHLVADRRHTEKAIADLRETHAAINARLGKIEGRLAPVQEHYAALNKAREEAAAELATADADLQVRKRQSAAEVETLKSEWAKRLTPARIGAIITTIVSLLAGGGVATGGMGRAQAAWDAFWGRGYDNVAVEPPVAPASPNNDAPPDPEPSTTEVTVGG